MKDTDYMLKENRGSDLKTAFLKQHEHASNIVIDEKTGMPVKAEYIYHPYQDHLINMAVLAEVGNRIAAQKGDTE